MEGKQVEGVEKGALEVKNVEKTVERGYLKCIPERMNEKEYEWELKERERRKRNIVLRGVRETRMESMYEIRKVIEEKLGSALR